MNSNKYIHVPKKKLPLPLAYQLVVLGSRDLLIELRFLEMLLLLLIIPHVRRSDKLKPFWLSLENEHLPTLDFLTHALLGGAGLGETPPGVHYQEALHRALKMPQCPVVPFFGAFLQDLSRILQNSPSLVVLTQDGHQLQVRSEFPLFSFMQIAKKYIRIWRSEVYIRNILVIDFVLWPI